MGSKSNDRQGAVVLDLEQYMATIDGRLKSLEGKQTALDHKMQVVEIEFLHALEKTARKLRVMIYTLLLMVLASWVVIGLLVWK